MSTSTIYFAFLGLVMTYQHFFMFDNKYLSVINSIDQYGFVVLRMRMTADVVADIHHAVGAVAENQPHLHKRFRHV